MREMMAQPGMIPDPALGVPLDRLLFPNVSSTDPAIKQRAMQVADDIRTSAKSCSELAGVANQIPGSIYAHLGTMKPGDLNKDLRDALLKSDPGQVMPPFFSPAGLEIIMRCDPKITKPVAFALPTHDQLQQQIFIQQMTILAKSYLRELRRDAVIIVH
jgi:peptidyl-prolyl cis-trans isomerase SurA